MSAIQDRHILPDSVSHSRWLVASLGFLLFFGIVLTWIPAFDDAANHYLNEATGDTLLAYGSARAINALISVIQSIELSVSLGAGVAVHLGEALDPLNDLVERFSAFVLYGLAGLGVQKLLLVASSSLVAKIVVSLTMLGAWCTWFIRGSLPNVFKMFLIVMIFLRFAFVVEVGLSWVLDKAYFDTQQQEALSTLDVAETKLQAIQNEYMDGVEDQGVFRGAWTTAKNLIGTDSQQQQGLTELTVDALVQLLVITLVRSILLPVGFLWVMYLMIRRFIA